jgi:hypothetical protein
MLFSLCIAFPLKGKMSCRGRSLSPEGGFSGRNRVIAHWRFFRLTQPSSDGRRVTAETVWTAVIKTVAVRGAAGISTMRRCWSVTILSCCLLDSAQVCVTICQHSDRHLIKY